MLTPQTPDEDADTVEVLTDDQFDEARADLLANGDPAKNWQRMVITETFAVRKRDFSAELPYTDVIESVSPDIHIFTANDCADKEVFFTISVSGRDESAMIRVDSPDFALVTEIHYLLVRRFNSLRSARSALDWLLNFSSFANAKSQSGGPLLRR